MTKTMAIGDINCSPESDSHSELADSIKIYQWTDNCQRSAKMGDYYDDLTRYKIV